MMSEKLEFSDKNLEMTAFEKTCIGFSAFLTLSFKYRGRFQELCLGYKYYTIVCIGNEVTYNLSLLFHYGQNKFELTKKNLAELNISN